jgi:hypothetical protein
VGGKRGNGRKPRNWAQIDVGRWEYTCKYHLRANQVSLFVYDRVRAACCVLRVVVCVRAACRGSTAR